MDDRILSTGTSCPKNREINYEAITRFYPKRILSCVQDKRTLLILFGLPVVQIVLFGFALSSEVKNISITY
jgi:ABC-2 type transport system permease protein